MAKERVEQEGSPEVLALLARAREHVRRGWTQYHQEDRQGNVCIYGALLKAEAETQVRAGAIVEAQRLLHLAVGSGVEKSYTGWNDEQGRTQEEVLQLMDGILARHRK